MSLTSYESIGGGAHRAVTVAARCGSIRARRGPRLCLVAQPRAERVDAGVRAYGQTDEAAMNLLTEVSWPFLIWKNSKSLMPPCCVGVQVNVGPKPVS